MSPVFRHGALRLYLLKLLDESPRHGYEVISRLEDLFLGTYSPSPGTVYPRLSRLEAEGLVECEESGGRKVYRLTSAGRAELAAHAEELQRLESDLRASVRSLADDVRADVRRSVSAVREDLKAAAREARRQERVAHRTGRAATRELSHDLAALTREVLLAAARADDAALGRARDEVAAALQRILAALRGEQ